ncbi:MAG TPA: hypothetical protein P5556_03450 [Candidatus Gastranaerophilales bacterium]|nr:hypothetical protein [Candidatus Gastranaerophilales bacterium]
MIKETIIGKHNPNPQKVVKDGFNIHFYKFNEMFGDDFFENEKFKNEINAYIDIRGAYNTLYKTLKSSNASLNYLDAKFADLFICWSNKHDIKNSNKIFMEHGWLPRFSFQLSPLGSNALGHYAKEYVFNEITDKQRDSILRHFSTLKFYFEQNIDFKKIDYLKEQIKEEFVIFPFQLANDFNLKHSNSCFARFYEPEQGENHLFAQECINFAEKHVDNIKIIFKQHPVDNTENFSEKVFYDNKKNSLILKEDKISLTELFLTGLCKGIISVNSNSVHEALLWGIPSICAGTLIWNEDTVKNNRPFGKDLEDLDKIFKLNVLEDQKTLSYINNILKNQWYLSDFQNPLMVKHLIETGGSCCPNDLRKEYGFY